jgi:O-antigen/teichoic acid export membrane protein
MIKFGATGFLGSSTPLEIFRVDQLAVGLLLAANDLALYTTALALCNLPRFLTQALGMNAYARIARQVSVAVRWRMLGRYTALAVVTALVVSLPLGLLAEPIIKLTFGPEFAGAVTITEILLVATVILCARRILSDCLRGVGLPGAGSVAEVASLVSLVPAAAILVHADGLDGFGLAMVVSYSVGLGVVILYMVKRRNADLDRPVPHDGGGQFAPEIGVGDGLNELDMPKAGPEKT